jgi:hypothetical protein
VSRNTRAYLIGAAIGAVVVGVLGLLLGLSIPEFEWFCPGSFDNYCDESRVLYFGLAVPPTIAVIAYAVTGALPGAILGPLLVLAFRTINAHRTASYAVGLGVVLGTLLFLVSLRV